MYAFGIVIIVVVVLGLVIGIGSIIYWNQRAKRLGLPPPPWQAYVPFATVPNSGGGGGAGGPIPDRPPTGLGRWILYGIRRARNRNSRTAAGAYEGAGSSRAAARQGFGPLDPDDAWDTRVGAEADAYYYNEEQELGLHPGGAGGQHGNASQLSVVGGGGGGGGGGSTAYLGSAGVAAAGSTYDMNVPAPTTTGGPAPPYAEVERGRTGRTLNPFDDEEAVSLRGVSPRPMEDATRR